MTAVSLKPGAREVDRPSSGWRRMVCSGVIAQSANSASNLIVAIFVARMLGLRALGEYGFMFSLLLTFVALQTAWVGDSLVVLGRADVVRRRGITWTQLLFCVGGALLGAVILLFGRAVGVLGVAGFACLVAVWQLEEYTRRALMARLAYWRQAICDASYGIATVLPLLICASVGRHDLTIVLWCMVAGASVATALGFFLISPDDRLRRADLRGRMPEVLDSLRVVASFGGWRAAQTGSSQGAQTLLRVLVLALASATTLGALEAARLVTAPLYTLLAALTNMALPVFARSRAQAPTALRKLANRSALIIAVLVVVYGAVVLALAAPATHLLVGFGKPVDRVAIAGWVLAALAFGYSQAFAVAALVGGASAEIFWLRLSGSVALLGSASLVLLIHRPELVPACMAAGGFLSAALIRMRGQRHLVRAEVALTGAG